MRVGLRDVLPDGSLEGSDTGVHTAAQLALREQREPAFHEVEPRGARRGEVQMEVGPLQQPPANQRRLMGAIVVQDHMHIQAGRDTGLNSVEELPELTRPMSVVQCAYDATSLHFQGRKERGRAMTAVVMRPTLDLSGTHRQQGARAVQHLNLGFLIQARDECFARRMEVEPHNIAHLLDKQRVGRQLERFRPMLLQPEGSPDPMHGTTAHPARLCHGARTPMRCVRGCHLQGLSDNPFNGRIRHRAGRAGAGLIQQPIEAVGDKALPPLPDGLRRHPD